MRFETDCIGKVSGDRLVKEIQQWQDELFTDVVEDEIIYNTLDTVISMIVGE